MKKWPNKFITPFVINAADCLITIALRKVWQIPKGDTDRINAIRNGFSIMREQQLTTEGRRDIWRCFYAIEKQTEGASLREAMDKAIIAYRNENAKGVQDELF